MKNLPNKIYLNFGEMTKEEFEKEDYNVFTKVDEYAVTFCEDKVYENDVEYIHKDVVDNMLKSAEDHAYFAGNEAMREKVKNKVEGIIDSLKKNCNPNPLGTTEECITAGEIEALERVIEIIEENI